MALKEHKFTFNMPVPGTQTSEHAVGGPSRSTSASGTPGMPIDKLPSPPISLIGANDKTRDPTPGSVRSNTGTSTSNYDSPRSAFSGSDAISPASRPGTSGDQNVFFNPEPYNAFANNAGNGDGGINAYAPFASAAEQAGAMANVDLQALLNAFKVQYGQPQTPGVPVQPSPAAPQFNAYRDVPGVDGTGELLGNEFDLAGNVSIDDLFGDDEAMKEFWKSLNQTESYDPVGLAEVPLSNQKQFGGSHGSVSPIDAATDAGPWSQTLMGARPGQPGLGALRSDSNGSANGRGGSVSGASADAAFSPNKYLTMSPESATVEKNPLETAELSTFGSKTQHPCPFNTMNVGTMSEGATVAHKLALDGARMMSTQEAWDSVSSKIDVSRVANMGTRQELTHLLKQLSNGFDLDDLCDSFKKKAQCDGSKFWITFDKYISWSS